LSAPDLSRAVGGATCFDVELPKVGKKIWARQSARMAQIRRD
jgi:hypothetical protein